MTTRGIVLTVLLAVGTVPTLLAQASEPIYVAYDGYEQHPDGSLTLWFGYFNPNHVEVMVPPGPDNLFSPGAGDRGQPSRFDVGRHRFVCTMVLPAKPDAPIQWTVRFAGYTATTTAKVLDPLYEMEAQAVERGTAGLSRDKATPGTCVNRAPRVTVAPPDAPAPTRQSPGNSSSSFDAGVQTPLALVAWAQDDGLPRDKTITFTWQQVSGPATAAFSRADGRATTLQFPAPGTYELRVMASDGAATGQASVRVTVKPKGE